MHCYADGTGQFWQGKIVESKVRRNLKRCFKKLYSVFLGLKVDKV